MCVFVLCVCVCVRVCVLNNQEYMYTHTHTCTHDTTCMHHRWLIRQHAAAELKICCTQGSACSNRTSGCRRRTRQVASSIGTIQKPGKRRGRDRQRRPVTFLFERDPPAASSAHACPIYKESISFYKRMLVVITWV